MTSAVFSVVLPVVLALVVFGLGLALTVADFTRVVAVPGCGHAVGPWSSR